MSAARGRAAVEGDRRARAAPHRAGLSVLRALLRPGDGARPGLDAHRRGRQRVPRLHRGHHHRQRRALPSALRRRAQAPGRDAHVRQLHHRDARPLPRPALHPHARGPDAHPDVLGRRRGRRGRAAARQGGHREARGHRLLGRIPRQDGRRPRAPRQRLQASPGPLPARPAPHAVCGLLSLPAALDLSRLRDRLRGLRPRRDPLPDRGRDRRDHRRAHPGHRRQYRPARGLPSRHRVHREGSRRAACSATR